MSAAVNALDVHAEVQAEIDAICAKLPPMPDWGPLTSGLCGHEWWAAGANTLPWGPGEGPGYICTENAGHAGDCKNRSADGKVLAYLRVKDREVRKQVPDPVPS